MASKTTAKCGRTSCRPGARCLDCAVQERQERARRPAPASGGGGGTSAESNRRHGWPAIALRPIFNTPDDPAADAFVIRTLALGDAIDAHDDEVAEALAPAAPVARPTFTAEFREVRADVGELLAKYKVRATPVRAMDKMLRKLIGEGKRNEVRAKARATFLQSMESMIVGVAAVEIAGHWYPRTGFFTPEGYPSVGLTAEGLRRLARLRLAAVNAMRYASAVMDSGIGSIRWGSGRRCAIGMLLPMFSVERIAAGLVKIDPDLPTAREALWSVYDAIRELTREGWVPWERSPRGRPRVEVRRDARRTA